MRFSGFALLVLAFMVPALRAQDAEDEAPPETAARLFPVNDLPPALLPWVKWAREGAPQRECPAAGGAAICAWPGSLSLDLNGAGGKFSQRLHAERKQWFALPGDGGHWPQGVIVDGKVAAVLAVDAAPMLRIEPGDHLIAGQFSWKKLPDALAVPADTALLTLSVNGRAVVFPARDQEGLLTLHGAESSATAEGDGARLKIFRRLSDGIPLWLETEFRFEIAGRARELRLPGALYPGATAVSVAGELPARLDGDGALRVQVRPGRFAVMVRARLPLPAAAKSANLSFKAAPAPVKQNGLDYPAKEYWSFVRNEALRAVNASGATEEDAARVEMPAGWRGGSTWSLAGDESLLLTETRRGAPPEPPDQISVQREWWLDEDGRGFTMRDHLTGTLYSVSRLEMTAPAQLGRASVDGAAQLLTGDAQSAGIELRRQALNLEADARITERPGKLPAVGWNTEAASLFALIHLPPGWRLLHAFGPDRVSGSWMSGWSLWGFFFILVMAAAVGKLAGWRWGLAAFFALGLCHHETGAPVITWVSLLLATALLRVLPEHWFKSLVKLWWGVSVVILIFLLMPFYVDQVRMALYPQLHPYPDHDVRGGVLNFTSAGYAQDRSLASAFDFAPGAAASAAASPPPSANAPAAAAPAAAVMESPSRGGRVDAMKKQKSNSPQEEAKAKMEEMAAADLSARQEAQGALALNSVVSQRLAPASPSVQTLQQDPHAIIQTGAGIPNWQWATASLSWSGRVPQDQTFRLLLIPRWLNFIFNLLRIGLTAALAFALLRLVGKSGIPSVKELNKPAPLALLMGMALLPAALQAQGKSSPSSGNNGSLPSPEILRELHNRLSRPQPPPACGANCVDTASARIALANGMLSVEAEVHAGAVAAWPVPGPLAAWTPSAITVDGKAASALVRREDGVIYVKLEPGIHKVEASGPQPPKDAFSLQFPLPPHRAAVEAPGWQVDGLRPEGGIETALQFTRRLAPGGISAAAAGNGNGGGSGYAPWLEVERVLSIGVTWQVETTVRRLSPPGTPVVARIPLLKGMLVTGSAPTEGNTVLVSLGAEELENHFSATLTPVENQPVTLNAPAAGGISTEVWTVICGPVWQCDASGVPALYHWAGGVRALQFRPWPEETLTLKFSKPKGIEGATLTVDSAILDLTPGQRLQDASLSLQVRASHAATLLITPPASARIISLRVNGVNKPPQLHGASLQIALDAGVQPVVLIWQQSQAGRVFYRAPEIKLAALRDGGPDGGNTESGKAVDIVNGEIQLHLPAERWLLFTHGPSWGPAILFWGIFFVVLIAGWALGRLPRSPLTSLQWALLAAGLTQVHLAAGLIVVFWFLALRLRALKPAPGRWRFNFTQLGLALWTVAFLICLGFAVYNGLVLHPDMQVQGAGSSGNYLRWQQDRIGDSFARPLVISVPMGVYQGLMFLWALWLAFKLVRWLGDGWRDFSSGGLWKSAPPNLPPPLPPTNPPATKPDLAAPPG